MNDTPSAPKSKLVWVFAAILCLCTLTALWVTAARVKGQKLAARLGERAKIEEGAATSPKARLQVSADTSARPLEEYFSAAPKGETVDVELDPSSPPQRQQEVLDAAGKHGVPVRFVAGDTRMTRLRLRRDQRLAVEHFTLHYGGRGNFLFVAGEKGAPLARFFKLRKGEQRGWQELRLTLLEVDPNEVSIEVDLRPGASSYGSGGYYVLRPGLRVEFDLHVAATILSWDPAKPELKLKVQAGESAEELTLGSEGQHIIHALRCSIGKDEDGLWGLFLQLGH